MKPTTVFVCAVLAAALINEPDARACSRSATNDRFTLFDAAPIAAIVRGQRMAEAKPRRDGSWPARLVVEKALKGSPGRELLVTVPPCCKCGGDITPGKRMVVFLDPAGNFVGGIDGTFGIDGDSWPDSLRAWAALTTPAGRAAFLVDTIEAGRELAVEAGHALAEHAELLVALTPTQIDRLVRVVGRDNDSLLPFALARLHTPGVVAALEKARGLAYGRAALRLARVNDFERGIRCTDRVLPERTA